MYVRAPVVFALCHNANAHVCMCTYKLTDNTDQSTIILFQVKSKGCLVHIITAKDEHFSTETALHNTNYYFKIKRAAESIQMWKHGHAQECIQCWFLTRITSVCMIDVLFWSPSHLLWPPSSLNKISGKDLSLLHAS